MGSNIIELAKLGHERATELKASCGSVDVRSVAQLISDLATQLEVQYVRAEESQREFRSADITMQNLEAKLKQSKIDADCYKKGMEASNVRLVQLAAENAALKAFKTAVYQQMGVGCDAPEFSITTGLSNLRRFADTLHAIEREFFTKELPDEEHEGETFNECPLSWGMSVEQYVSEFRKCLAEVRAQGVEMFADNLLCPDLDGAIREFAAQLRKGAAL